MRSISLAIYHLLSHTQFIFSDFSSSSSNRYQKLKAREIETPICPVTWYEFINDRIKWLIYWCYGSEKLNYYYQIKIC